MAKLTNSGDPLTEDFPTGPGIGDAIPDFELPDHRGGTVRFAAGVKGKRALILFYRSASW
jgi:peroxiredoxin